MIYAETDDNRLKVFTLSHQSGIRATITNLGATLMSLRVPDREGRYGNVVLGFQDARDYRHNPAYLGAVIGRYAGRIANGSFELGGSRHQLDINSNGQHLHGGERGFDRVIWSENNAASDHHDAAVSFHYTSLHGEGGYPGNLKAEVSYALTADRALRISYRARTDAPTIVNLTSHSYFNLAGDSASTTEALGHQLRFYASRYTPNSPEMIPSTEPVTVAGTPFDFRSFKSIGSDIDSNDHQIQAGHGYDHFFLIDSKSGKLKLAAEVWDPHSGRTMEMWTTEPGFQFYSGNFLKLALDHRSGQQFSNRSAFCLEAQHSPDSPNHPNWPTTVLMPDQIYEQVTIYRFATK